MFGFFYSVKQYFKISRNEWTQLFWTSLAFSFILTAFFKGFLRKPIILEDTLIFLLVSFIFVSISLLFHISFQKIMAIKLGYVVTYTYWLNGILFSLFLSFFSLGFIPFILPGSFSMIHVPKLRLGKFRYNTNLKDLARVAMAGPLAHIILVMFLGVFFFIFDKNEIIYTFILINLMLAIFSVLPIPKLDIPTKMDAASDGLAVFFFSRPIYIMLFFTILFYAVLILLNNIFSFVIAFVLGLIMSLVYSFYVEQKN